MSEQMNIFECLYPVYKITKPIRLIELFAGYGSQALALKYLGVPFEHWKICEWNHKSFEAYKAIHMTNDITDYSKELSKDELAEFLKKKNISANWNEPMSAAQIGRLSESKQREIYNNIIATHNLVDVSSTHAEDLEITEQDKYTYILTYSFPCQDLSLAGLRQGMDRESGTRSSMLYQVERILHECKDRNTMPDVLIMENVVQVHGTDNTENWRGWLTELEKLGYQSYWQDLIATDYGIPQIRNRTFCISIRGDYAYNFPAPITLKKRLKDILETAVSERYYLSNKGITGLARSKDNGGHSATLLTGQEEACKTIDTRVGAQAHWLQYIAEKETYINIPNATKKGYLKAEPGDGIDISSRMLTHRGTVQKNKIQTITTQPERGVVVVENREPKVALPIAQRGRGKGEGLRQHFECRNEETANALTTVQKDSMVVIADDQIKMPTVIVKKNLKEQLVDNLIENDSVKENDVIRHSYTKARANDARVAASNMAPTLDTRSDCFGVVIKAEESTMRIRKLTPRECFRLQGVKDQDIDKLDKMSDSAKYHLAGDSICATVLMAIFGQLCGIEWQSKVNDLHEAKEETTPWKQ